MTTDDLQDSWVDPRDLLPWLPSEPYFAPQSRRDELVEELGKAGFTVLEADLADVTTESDLLTVLGRALSAPDHYGENWDALTDILRDRGADTPFRIALVLSSSAAFLGADVPNADVIDRVAQQRADVLAVSATMAGHIRQVRALISELRADPRCQGVRVLVGGRPFTINPSLAQAVGDDGYAPDARAALALCQQWASRGRVDDVGEDRVGAG